MSLKEILKNSDSNFKKNLLFFLLSYFVVLFNYPLVRASTTSVFLSLFGAKSSPYAWIWAVLFLSITIKICSDLQAKFSVQKVFLGMSLASGLFFIIGFFAPALGLGKLGYISFVWKEIYIVLQVHLLLAYGNNYFSRSDFKTLLGPVGAFGSIGGVLGGLLTTYLTEVGGTNTVSAVGIFFVIVPSLLFFLTSNQENVKALEMKTSPLKSLSNSDVKLYIFYIALIVALTQFIINIADLRFHVELENTILNSEERTKYLGHIYTITNALTFVFQFLVIPLILPRVSERFYHFLIPVTYLVLFGSIFSFHGLLPLAMFYVYLKASDYSIFTAGKEILYQVLDPTQKYGAKYLTDMLVYRLAKALIAVILIYLQTSFILNMLMGIFIILWIILIYFMFKLHKKLFHV